jgi:hypothetical protein
MEKITFKLEQVLTTNEEKAAYLQFRKHAILAKYPQAQFDEEDTEWKYGLDCSIDNSSFYFLINKWEDFVVTSPTPESIVKQISVWFEKKLISKQLYN